MLLSTAHYPTLNQFRVLISFVIEQMKKLIAILTIAILAAQTLFLNDQRLGGIHAGSWAFAVNAVICWWGIRRERNRAAAL